MLKPSVFKKFQPGDAVEVVWQDACTMAKWSSVEEAAKLELALILTRGTLVAIREDAMVVALDAGLQVDGSVSDHHGVGAVPLESVVEIYKLKRVK